MFYLVPVHDMNKMKERGHPNGGIVVLSYLIHVNFVPKLILEMRLLKIITPLPFSQIPFPAFRTNKLNVSLRRLGAGGNCKIAYASLYCNVNEKKLFVKRANSM